MWRWIWRCCFLLLPCEFRLSAWWVFTSWAVRLTPVWENLSAGLVWNVLLPSGRLFTVNCYSWVWWTIVMVFAHLLWPALGWALWLFLILGSIRYFELCPFRWGVVLWLWSAPLHSKASSGCSLACVLLNHLNKSLVYFYWIEEC